MSSTEAFRNAYGDVSRRKFLMASTTAGGAMLLVPKMSNALGDEVDPRVAQVMSQTIGIDMHNHVYPAGTEPHPQWGGQRGPGQASQPKPQQEQQQAPELFLSQELTRSVLTAVCASFVLDFAPNTKPGDARENLLSWFAAIDLQLKDGHIQRAFNLKDLQAAHDNRQPTIVQSVEGSMFIEGRLDRV
jgi:membrane dipeptidase